MKRWRAAMRFMRVLVAKSRPVWPQPCSITIKGRRSPRFNVIGGRYRW